LSAGGLYDGLVFLVDDETLTWWDHVTGEALQGEFAGHRLPLFGVDMHTVQTALARWPDLRVHISRPGFLGGLLARVMSWLLQKGPLARRFPPGFRKTMGEVDSRLPEHEMGLGLVGATEQIFLPMKSLTDGLDLDFEGQSLHAAIDSESGIPYAEDPQGHRPIQLWARWYGFSASYPDCKIG